MTFIIYYSLAVRAKVCVVNEFAWTEYTIFCSYLTQFLAFSRRFQQGFNELPTLNISLGLDMF